MIIRKRSSLNANIRKFYKSEWPQADLIHFGHNTNWNTKKNVLAAYIKNSLAGVLEIKVEAGVGYISTLIVARNKRQIGVGTALMEKAKLIALKQGAHKIYLQTGKNWESVGFYKKLGYKITGELKNHYFHEDFIELTCFIRQEHL